ncbi:hypothetical protein [Archangium lansingense]|uniref:Type IV pilus assembly protein PilX n=1 Tax=Archangium lansingense TaxID=2995310 RepID=A0ABT4A147_9BACT|nr:hypothetical protein [Archangium lansinium]MCY1074722.1 hypothetical protein [Archangium lansinium]
MKKRLGRRGSVLLLVVVLLAVISLLAAAAVSFSHSELGAARNERSGDELLACADAGRQYMLSRFSFLDGAPVDLSAVNVDLNAAGATDCPPAGDVPPDSRCARSGHIGQMSVAGVTAVESTAGGNRRALRDLSNTVGKSTLGGVPHKITVHCVDENGRGTEVEFVVRFGL